MKALFYLCVVMSGVLSGCGQTTDPKKTNPKVNQLYFSRLNLVYNLKGETLVVDEYSTDSLKPLITDTVVDEPFDRRDSITINVPDRTQYGFKWRGGNFFLNAETKLVAAADKSNNYKLKGKALIECSKDSENSMFIDIMPYVIKIFPGSVVDISNYDSDSIKLVTLVGGTAEIELSANDTGKAKMIHPGEQYTWIGKERSPRVTLQDTEDVAKWINGQLTLAPSNFKVYGNEVGRWFGKTFKYDGNYDEDGVNACTIVLDNQFESYLKVMEVGFGYRCISNGDTTTVYKNKDEQAMSKPKNQNKFNKKPD